MSGSLGTTESADEVKIVGFPPDRCLGHVDVRKRGVAPERQAAQGDIEVPVNAGLMLVLDDEGCADPEPLRDLRPTDIHALVALGDFGDRGLAAIAHLTSLSMLQAGGEVTDVGLASLAGLTRLAVVNLSLGTVTAAGIARLAALPSLMQLTLRGPVRAADVAVLADAGQLAGLDLPDADPATVDAVRRAVSTIPINGTWLSPKAMAKLAVRGAEDEDVA